MKKIWKSCTRGWIQKSMLGYVFLTMFLLLSVTGAAAKAQEMDGQRSTGEKTGSIEVRLPESGSGVEITLYKVADYENTAFSYSTDFAGSGISVSSLGDNEETQKAADGLAAYAADKKIDGSKGVVSADGKVRFEQLLPGLYLTAQTSGKEILTVQAALIPIPYYTGGAEMESYDAIITAKHTFPGGAVIGTKVDENGDALPGAAFVLQEKTYLQEGESAPSGMETESDEKGVYYWKELKQGVASGNAGQFAVRGLDTGDYRFVETAAPEGYVRSDEVYPFTISRFGVIEETGDSYKAAGGQVEQVKVVNEPTVIRILKVDTDGNPVSGAKLALKDEKGILIRDENGLPKYSFVTDGKPFELKKLPAGTYYVTELEAPQGYTIAHDVRVELKAEADGVSEVTMVDEKQPQTPASITVTKKLTDIVGNVFTTEAATFYVALFEDEACTIRISEVKALEFKKTGASSVTFENLQTQKAYYVGETDQYGELLENGLYGNVLYAAQFPEGRKIALTGADENGTLEFQNVFMDIPDGYYYEGELTITKKVLRGTKEEASDQIFYAAVFTDEARTQRYGEVITLAMNGLSSVSATVPVYAGDSATESVRYYISETTADGTPLNADMGLDYTFTVDKGSVVMSMQNTSETIVITNTFAEETEEETEFETEVETEVEEEEEDDDVIGSGSGGPTVSNGVQTGDDTPIWLYAVLLGISALLIIVLLAVVMIRRAKRRR